MSLAFISASLLHHWSHCWLFIMKSCFLVSCWAALSSALLLAVGLALKILMRRLTSPVHCLASGGRKECGDLKGLGVDREIAKVDASWKSADRACNI